MPLKNHILYTGIPAIMLFPILGINSLFFFLAGILIDVDHYFLYISETRKYSIRGMFSYFDGNLESMKSKIGYNLCVFHTVELLIVLGFFSFYSSIVFYVFIGLVFHILLDVTFLYRNNCLYIRAHSFLEYFVRRRKM